MPVRLHGAVARAPGSELERRPGGGSGVCYRSSVCFEQHFLDGCFVLVADVGETRGGGLEIGGAGLGFKGLGFGGFVGFGGLCLSGHFVLEISCEFGVCL